MLWKVAIQKLIILVPKQKLNEWKLKLKKWILTLEILDWRRVNLESIQRKSSIYSASKNPIQLISYAISADVINVNDGRSISVFHDFQ